MEEELYKKMYAILCCAASDAIDQLRHMPCSEAVSDLLQDALWKAEELYIDSRD